MFRLLTFSVVFLTWTGFSQTRDNGYVAPASCQPCHARIYASYITTVQNSTYSLLGSDFGEPDGVER